MINPKLGQFAPPGAILPPVSELVLGGVPGSGASHLPGVSWLLAQKHIVVFKRRKQDWTK